MSLKESSRFPEFCRDIESYRQLLESQCRSLELDTPDDDASQVSFQLAQAISQHVSLSQKIPFSEFMNQALYAPGLGYYSAGSRKFGVSGDFVTAPEISPLFGKTLARVIKQAWSDTRQDILELGAGTGKLMCDLLEQLELDGALPNTYFILEVSAELRQRQQQLLASRLPHLVSKVQWLERLPENFNGVILGNEVVDAIPAELLMKTEEGLAQGFVKQSDSGFELMFEPTDFSRGWQKKHSEYCQQWPEGYIAEAYDARSDWLRAVVESLQQGCILLLDYGFEEAELYSPYRPQGTLQCYYRQKKHSMPLALLGLQDITSSVNFTQLAYAAKGQDADILGFTTQAQFLTLSGIEQFVAIAQDSDTMSTLSVAQQLQTLLMPHEMGQAIKVLGISKEFTATLPGFTSL